MLRDIRLQKGYSISELARLSGINRVTLSNIERGRININNVTLKNVLKLCKALGCRPEDL